MSVKTITVYNNRDNTESIQFLVNGVVRNLSDITRVKLILNSSTTVDSSTSADVFNWTSTPTQMNITLGGESLTVGSYESAQLVLYDSSNTNGVLWDTIDVIVKSNDES